MPKKFLTVNEVSRILGVTPLTIRNWDKKGKLAAYRNPFNNYRMYKIEDVELLLKNIDSTKGQGFINGNGNGNIDSSGNGDMSKPKIKKLVIEVE